MGVLAFHPFPPRFTIDVPLVCSPSVGGDSASYHANDGCQPSAGGSRWRDANPSDISQGACCLATLGQVHPGRCKVMVWHPFTFRLDPPFTLLCFIQALAICLIQTSKEFISPGFNGQSALPCFQMRVYRS